MGNSSRKFRSVTTTNSGNQRNNGTSALPADFIQQSQMETEQHLAQLAILKEKRRLELMAFEEQQAKRLEEEAQMNNKIQANRDKFLSHVTESQRVMENQLAQIHQKQEKTRLKFSEELCKSETEMEASILGVLRDIRAHRDQNQLQELVQEEEKQSRELLALKLEEFKSLRKADILDAMKKQLEQDITSQKSNNKAILFSAAVVEDEEKNRQIEEILKHRQKDQASLVMALLEEESWQCQAFTSLLSHRDRRTAQINDDIKKVVDQLNQLTSWELQRKSQQQDITTNTLAENRLQLADLLQQLIHQQEQRRKDLMQLLEEMEEQRQNQAADYWLVQYQRLMDNMPDSIVFVQYDPYLPNAPPLIDSPGVSVDQLPDSCAGFSSTDIRQPQQPPPPSAPDEIFMETTCVICLDSMCQVIFIPCGHLCCCKICSDTVDQCPMCRAPLLQRLEVNV